MPRGSRDAPAERRPGGALTPRRTTSGFRQAFGRGGQVEVGPVDAGPLDELPLMGEASAALVSEQFDKDLPPLLRAGRLLEQVDQLLFREANGQRSGRLGQRRQSHQEGGGGADNPQGRGQGSRSLRNVDLLQ